jgi:hypothetical protein
VPVPFARDGVRRWRNKRMKTILLFFFVATGIFFSLSHSSFSADKIPTKIIVRVVSKDAKVIGSGVGGALVRIRSLETGEILAQGKQEGGTGDTDRIMVRPRKRGETVFGTPDAALYQAEILLGKPTQIEIYTEAPLAYPHAIQKGSKTLTLIPGKDIVGEGVLIELDGLIVNILDPAPNKDLKKGKEITVKAEVKML